MRTWLRVFGFGLWSMIMLGIGGYLGGNVVRGEPADLRTATQAEVDRAWDALLVCTYEVVMAGNALNLAWGWLSVPTEDQGPPVVWVEP